MGLFDFFRKRKLPVSSATTIEPDRSNLKGKDFEFLIQGDIDIPNDEFDRIMTPNSFIWRKLEKNDWVYYEVDGDEFSYSIEPPGIQMVFNKDIPYIKAKKIVDEVIKNILETGQEAVLVIVDSTELYNF